MSEHNRDDIEAENRDETNPQNVDLVKSEHTEEAAAMTPGPVEATDVAAMIDLDLHPDSGTRDALADAKVRGEPNDIYYECDDYAVVKTPESHPDWMYRAFREEVNTDVSDEHIGAIIDAVRHVYREFDPEYTTEKYSTGWPILVPKNE